MNADDDLVPIAGNLRAIVARPADPSPAVIMYAHVGGLTDTMRTMAATVAGLGYACVVPDPYHRLGTIVLDPQSMDEDAIAVRKIAAASVVDANVLADTQTVLDWLKKQEFVTGSACGTVGFGRGGSFALKGAAHFPGRIAAAASILGFGFTQGSEEDWLAKLRSIRGEIYCAFAELDEIIPASEPAALQSMLDQVDLPAELVVHAGAHHPYVFPDRDIHDKDAAARDWGAIAAMFSRCLGVD